MGGTLKPAEEPRPLLEFGRTLTTPKSACFYIQVKVWDCNTGECLETLKVRHVLTRIGTRTGTTRQLRLMLCCPQGLLDVAHACVFTPDGKLLVSGSADTAT